MIRALVLFVALFAAALAAAWLADHPGRMALDWQGWRIEAPVALVFVALFVALALAAAVHRFWLWLARSPQSLAQNRERKRERQGYEALTKGLVAVAAGDASQARRQARQAESLLEAPPLTRLLSAQAAQLDGDDRSARKYFEEMLGSPDTEFLALRGLLTTALREGDHAAALDYATRAHSVRPDANWATEALFDLQARAGLWKEAQVTLTDAGRTEALTPEQARRRKAIALHAQALEAEAAGDRRRAIKLFEQAHTSAPDLVVAALDGARLLLAANKIRRASEMIERCWRDSPHPALAALYQALWVDEKAGYMMQRLERLHALNPGSREGRLALAGQLIEARQFDEARAHLAPLVAADASIPPEQRLCRLMADLEEGESGQAASARDWLLQMETAPADPAWACGDCGSVTRDWSAHCPTCGTFDSLDWQTLPGSSDVHAATPGPASAANPEPAENQPPKPDIDESPASA
jgi:HemY protein